MKENTRGILFAFAAILLWSTIASAFKLSLRYMDFIDLMATATWVSTVFLFLVLLFQRKLPVIAGLGWNRYMNGALLGLLNPFLYYLVLLKAYSLLRAQEAGTLNYIWPITLVLLSIPLLGKKINIVSISAIFISFFGILVISTEGNPGTLQFREPWGAALAVGSSIFWSLYWILNMKNPLDEVVGLFINFLFGSLYILVLILIRGGYTLTLPGLAGGAYIGIFEMGLTFILWLKALKLAQNTALVSNLVYLSPFISLAIIRLAVNEEILASTFAGLIFIVAGILIQQQSRRIFRMFRRDGQSR